MSTLLPGGQDQASHTSFCNKQFLPLNPGVACQTARATVSAPANVSFIERQVGARYPPV